MGPGSRLGVRLTVGEIEKRGDVACMLENGTSCLGMRAVRNGNGKANEDKKKTKILSTSSI